MSETPNVWEAAESSDKPAGPKVEGIGPDSHELPPVVDLFMDTMNDFQVHWKGHLLLGFGAMLVAFPLIMVIVGVSITPMLAGIVLESQLLMLLGMFVYMFGIIGGSAVIMGPITFAIFSAENRHLDGEEDALGFGGVFRHMFDRIFSAIGYQLIAMGLGMVGLLFFIVGAWAVQIAIGLALPALVVHRMGLGGAFKQSVLHMKDNPVWHLGFWGLGFVTMMIAGNIPIVGYAIGLPFLASYTLRGYRAVFGNGVEE